ncbi:phosphate ABC transporter, permease protein PstA [Boudabousia liubingyangii]|uniref:Phosphate transport system permease protein PstA n=1 Tax=Boudabousia liubingyangii TaxID=1921764 RepID=A0A1Q5PK45_9ACTO|nr:phosphate ABC transporter permease PstA [Boudabousia liubingyangii]OKL46562.1 phosphate ABC transporter, permease protein PstA [Boudabousia liubingyangii]OKL46853.1 phosphate ABC transporter, permease protein PstA [Boudabousia liubingyangii]
MAQTKTKPNPFAPADPGLERSRARKNWFAGALVTIAFALAMIPLVSLLGSAIGYGAKMLTPSFLSYSMNGVFGQSPQGGAYHAIIGTLLVTLGATLISVPIGLFTAIYLTEYGFQGRLARFTRFLVDVMTGIPSIVAGLFALAFFTIIMGPAYISGFRGSVALSILMIPTVVRSSEEMLRLVPNELREASYALGVPKWLTIVKVVLRTSAAGLTTSVMLAIARVIGETAPLLVTVGATDRINFNLFDERMSTLPVFVYQEYTSVDLGCAADAVNCSPTIHVDRAWGAALALIIIVMVLNLLARGIAWKLAPKGKN